MTKVDRSTQCTYGPMEQLLNEKFEVLHLFRDTRHDWGDDGGYLVSISKKEDLYYLHILQINYNGDLNYDVLDEEDWENVEDKEHAFKDYFTFGTIEEAQGKIIELCKDLDRILEEYEDHYLWDDDSFDQFEWKTWTKLEKQCLAAMAFPYSEYSRDKIVLTNLINYEYKYNETDEKTLVHSNGNILPLIKKGISPVQLTEEDKNQLLSRERFNLYHSIIDEDFLITENVPEKTIIMFMGYAIAKHMCLARNLLFAANSLKFNWAVVQDVYDNMDLFYDDLSDFLNNTKATKERFNVKLKAVEKYLEST